MRDYNLVAVGGRVVLPGTAANAQGTLDLGGDGNMSGATHRMKLGLGPLASVMGGMGVGKGSPQASSAAVRIFPVEHTGAMTSSSTSGVVGAASSSGGMAASSEKRHDEYECLRCEVVR